MKKKMKMADLRAFVETKLLSKSEKTLEKIGRDDAKPIDEVRIAARRPDMVTHARALHARRVPCLHRKTQTQNLGQLNPENKGIKNIFGGHFDTYTKMIRKRRNGFLNRSQNVL